MEHIIGKLSQIPPGEGRNFEVGDLRIAVFHTRDGGVFATQADCPHKGGPLADGLTDGQNVVCPLHDRTYDFHTGAGPDCSIQVYPARVGEGETIFVVTESAMASS
jgi:nitrite reductase (NADH) small subunit